MSWNQLSHTREQLGITRKHVITLTHLDTRNNPWQKVNTLVTYPQIDHSTIPYDMSRLYTGIFCENCNGRDPWRVKWGLHFLIQGLRRNLTPVYSNVCEAAPIGNLSTRRSWFTDGMAGGAELDRARCLRAKCKSLSKPTWNHHERWQNNSFLSNICVKFCFFLTKKTWFRTKDFFFWMTNTLRRTQNLNFWFQPENSRFEVCGHNSRTSWQARCLSCCKNTSGWRPWYQEHLVLKFPDIFVLGPK